jgi:phage gpG-like protein
MVGKNYSLSDYAASVRSTSESLRGIPQPLQQPLAMLFQADVRQQFYGSHDERGVPWSPLGRPRPQGGSKPLLNTGILANSYTAGIANGGVEVSSTHPGAALHQNGGIVRPKTAKALALPQTPEAARYPSPRRFPRKLFTRQGGRGLYESVGKKLTMHYLFAAFVKIMARPVGFSQRAIDEAGEMLAEYWSGRLST